MCNQLVEVVRTVFLIILYLVIMFRMNVRLSFVALAFIPIVGLSSGVFYRRISGRFQAADEAEGDLTTCAQENLTGVRVVRAFGRERFETDRFCEKNEKFASLWIRLGRLLSVYWASGTLLTCLQVMVIIVCGIVESVHGNMTLGEFLAFISYNEALSWPGPFARPRAFGHEQGGRVARPRGLYPARAGGEGRARGRAAQR